MATTNNISNATTAGEATNDTYNMSDEEYFRQFYDFECDDGKLDLFEGMTPDQIKDAKEEIREHELQLKREREREEMDKLFVWYMERMG